MQFYFKFHFILSLVKFGEMFRKKKAVFISPPKSFCAGWHFIIENCFVLKKGPNNVILFAEKFKTQCSVQCLKQN